jgi:hypothetical protein
MSLKTSHLLTLSATAATVVAGAVTYVAAEHNAQDESNRADGELSIVLLFTRVFLIYFVAAFGAVFLLGFLVKGVLGENSR